MSVFRHHPLLVRFCLWIGLPLSILAFAALWYFRQSLPIQEGSVRMPGLAAPVRIVTDSYGVPHIFAQTDRDAFFALGYLHAQNRMWQMESQRRLGQGRLSELLGRSMLQTDELMRTLGLYRVARNNLAHLDPGARMSLEAYAQGVNAWLASDPVLPIEFHALGFRPEPWKPEDSLLQIKLVAFSLDRNYRLELAFSLLTKALGAERASQLRARYPRDSAVVTEAQRTVSADALSRLLALNERTDHVFRLAGAAAGSNGWVISGRYTQTGKPLLANDPHLKNQVPSIWYLAELQGDKLHVAGATVPGLPLIMTGHNESVAWGVTALEADTQDLFLERMHVANDNLYEVNGHWEPVRVEEELIDVRADFPLFLNPPLTPVKWAVRSTRHGPLISDALGSVSSPMALEWCALKDDDISYAAFLSIDYARDWSSFRKALESYTAPALNFVYADREGNIGYSAGAAIPLRRSGDGSLPVPAWTGEFDWVGTVPAAELPHAFNPPSGFLVTANNKIHDDTYPYFISRDWAPGYRANRIKQLILDEINAGHKLSVEDLIRMQGDERNVQAEELLPFITSVSPVSARQKQALEYLRKWDLQADETSVAASIYHAWLRRFNHSIIEEAMTADVLHAQRRGDHEALYEQLYPLFLDELAHGRQQEWCDIPGTAQVETCAQRALSSLDEALQDLERIGGSRMSNWQWGKLHSAHFPHSLFTNVRVLDSLFDRSVPHGGDAYTVDVAPAVFSSEKGYRDEAGASYRQVIDAGDWSRSRFISNTGQSGNVLSPHYDDFIRRNKELRLLPMTFGEAGMNGRTLRLLPAGSQYAGS